MGNRTWKTVRQRDKSIVEALEKIANAAGLRDTWTLNVTVFQGTQPIVNGTWMAHKDSPVLAEVLNLDEPTIYQFTAGFPTLANAYIQLTRSPDDYGDSIVVHVPDGHGAQPFVKLVADAIAFFPTFASTAALEKILGKEVAEFYRTRESALLRLEGLSQKIIEGTERYRESLDTQHDTRRTKLEEETATERQRLQAEYDARSQALDSRSAQLDQIKQDLEDQDSRNARRKLRKDLQAELAGRSKSFSLTKDTVAKRRVIHGLFIIALVGDATFIGVSATSQLVHTDAWITIARLSIGVIGFAVLLVYYIRWSDQWFRQHADEEFRLKRMSLDVDRASWVVETAMEWQQQNKSPIPEQLLGELTRGLFTPTSGASRVRHPLEQWASAVFGAASKVELDVPGFGKASVGRGGARKLQESMKGGESNEGE